LVRRTNNGERRQSLVSQKRATLRVDTDEKLRFATLTRRLTTKFATEKQLNKNEKKNSNHYRPNGG